MAQSVVIKARIFVSFSSRSRRRWMLVVPMNLNVA